MTTATHARALVLETPRHLVEHAVRAPRDRRRRRPPAGRGVRALRHRPRAVHRPAPPRPALRPRSRDRRDRRGGRARRGRRALGRAARRPGGRAGVPVVPGVRRLPAGRPPPLPAARDGHDVRVPGHRGPAEPLGRLRHPPLPRARLAAPPRPRRARSGARHGVQPARGRHPVGRHGARARRPATGWRCSARASAVSACARRPRTPAPSS